LLTNYSLYIRLNKLHVLIILAVITSTFN